MLVFDERRRRKTSEEQKTPEGADFFSFHAFAVAQMSLESKRRESTDRVKIDGLKIESR